MSVSERRLRAAFAVFDKDNSGDLDADELLSILTRPGGKSALSKADAHEFIGLFDTDGEQQTRKCPHIVLPLTPRGSALILFYNSAIQR